MKTQSLDKYQEKLLTTKYSVRIIAGAGSGKTFTLISKIYDLIENENISPTQILIISFTNASVDDIKRKLKCDIDVLTFHKLAIKILDNSHYHYKLISNTTLAFLINEYLICASKDEQKAILKYIQYDGNYRTFLKSNNFKYFKTFIQMFINQYQSNNHDIYYIQSIKYNKIESKILAIIFKIIYNYNQEKNSTKSIDLNDLIVFAKESLIEGDYDYKYILIDEFQDTSYVRFELVNKLRKVCNAKIIVVGDDWQSIYRFSGCTLDVFLHLDKYVPNLETIELARNYRNSNDLLKITQEFIERNKYQIKKNLHSNIELKNPLIFVPYKNRVASLSKILDKLIETQEEDVMILSRNNDDILKYIDKNYTLDNSTLTYKNHLFTYLTVHKSKGLESKIVILLNCNNEIMGFPNQLEDNSIMKKTFSSNEPLFSEERRLMYVALTRTKSYIYILYDKNNPSPFIYEIQKINKKISRKSS